MVIPALPFLVYASNASSSTFPSFASCGVHILSKTVDQELLTHLREYSSTTDSFYCLVDLFKHMQEYPLLSSYLRAKGSSHIGIGEEDGHKKASLSTDTNTTNTTMAGHATPIMYKQFGSRLLLKNFIFTLPSVESILSLYLRQKRLAAQQQHTVGSSSTTTSIEDPHAVAFASLCTVLGMKLLPALDDILVIGEEEDDAGDEEEMEEEGEEEEDWVAPSRNDKNDESNKSTENMRTSWEVDEEGGLKLMEIAGEEKEEGNTMGNILASCITVVKKNYTIHMPKTLRAVWILSPALQLHFIEKIW